MDKYFLSEQQVLFFRKSGYFKSPFLLDENLILGLNEKIDELFKTPEQPFRTDSNGGVWKIHDLINRNKYFHDFITSNILLDQLESLLGPNIEFCLNRLNQVNRNKKGDKVNGLHRDVMHWSRTIISVLVYLEDSTIENGCTGIIPASQYLPFVPTSHVAHMAEHPVYQDLINQVLPIPMKRGSILFLDASAFHTIGINQTDRTRTTIALAYHSVDELSGNDIEKYKYLVRGQRIYVGNLY